MFKIIVKESEHNVSSITWLSDGYNMVGYIKWIKTDKNHKLFLTNPIENFQTKSNNNNINNNNVNNNTNNEPIDKIEKVIIIEEIQIFARWRNNNLGKFLLNKFTEYIKNNEKLKEYKLIILVAFEEYWKYNKLINYYKECGFEVMKNYIEKITYFDEYQIREVPMFIY